MEIETSDFEPSALVKLLNNERLKLQDHALRFWWAYQKWEAARHEPAAEKETANWLAKAVLYGFAYRRLDDAVRVFAAEHGIDWQNMINTLPYAEVLNDTSESVRNLNFAQQDVEQTLSTSVTSVEDEVKRMRSELKES